MRERGMMFFDSPVLNVLVVWLGGGLLRFGLRYLILIAATAPADMAARSMGFLALIVAPGRLGGREPRRARCYAGARRDGQPRADGAARRLRPRRRRRPDAGPLRAAPLPHGPHLRQPHRPPRGCPARHRRRAAAGPGGRRPG